MYYIGKIREMADYIGSDDPVVRETMELFERFPEMAEHAFWRLEARMRELDISLSDPPVFKAPLDLPAAGMPIGNVMRGETALDLFRLASSLLVTHVGIFGETGSGKSRLLGLIVRSLIERGIRVFLFDVADEFVWLAYMFPQEMLRVIDARKLAIAPFHNPAGSCRTDLEWLAGLCSDLRAPMFMRDGSANLLYKIAGDMYRKGGVFEGSGNYPKLSEVFRELISSKFSVQSRHSGYLETLVNRFQGLLQSFPYFDTARPVDPEWFLDRSALIRMPGVTPAEIDVFVNIFLMWMNSYVQRETRPGTEFVIAIDEAHLFISRYKQARNDLADSLIEREVRMSRKYGLGFLIADQVPSELPPAVLGNLATKFVFRLTNFRCMRAMSLAMGMSGDQEGALGKLGRRQAVVQSPDSPAPFLMRVAEIPDMDRPREEELRERETVSLSELDFDNPDTGIDEVLFSWQRKEKEDAPSRIAGDEYKVLESIVLEPYKFIEERAEDLGMDRAREFRARRNLLKRGMIEKAGKVGAKWEAWVATEKGIRFARTSGIHVYTYKGSIFHEIMVRKTVGSVKRFSERAEVISLGEAMGVSGKQPDILIGIGQLRIAIQVSWENKSVSEAENAIELAGTEGIDYVVVVARNKSARTSIEKRVAQAGGGANIRILDFETCIAPDFDWSFMLGNG